MLANGIAIGAAILSLPVGVLSELVTITAYATTCGAIYTTVTASSILGNGSTAMSSGTENVISIQSTATQPFGTQSTSEHSTTVVSTVTVSPIPISDTALNSGTVPFVLQIQPGVPYRRRQASQPTYIDANGYVTANASQAVQYVIDEGHLSSTTGGWVSTDEGVDSMPFAISPTLGTISTQFTFESLKLHWKTSALDGGEAVFYTVPASTTRGISQVVVRFAGPLRSDWAPVSFAVQPAAGLFIESASPVLNPTSALSAVPVGSATAPSPAPVVVTSVLPSEFRQGTPTIVNVSSSTTAIVAPSGTCGPDVGFNCYSAYSGGCCSTYGFCGSGPEYCGPGCQPGYGICDTPVASSSDNEAASPAQYPVQQSSAGIISYAPTSRTGVATSTELMDTSAAMSYLGPTPPASNATSATSVSSPLSSPQYPSGSGFSPAASTARSISEALGNTLSIYAATGEPVGPDHPFSSSQTGESTTSSSQALEISSSSLAVTSLTSTSITDLEVFPSSVPDATTTASSLTDLQALPSTMPNDDTTSASSSSNISATIPAPPAYSSAGPASSSSIASYSAVVTTTSSSLLSPSSTASPPDGYSNNGKSSPPPILSSSMISVIPYSTTSTIATSTASPYGISSTSSALASSSYANSASSFPSSASSSYLVLTSPTPCYFGDPPSFDEDDSYQRIDLPQPMYIGASSSTATFAAVNGLLSITVGSAEYQYGQLPSTRLPAGTIVPYWADLAIYRINTTGPPQGLFYQLDGSGITYEWYLNRAGNKNELFHFTVQYQYALPGLFTYAYYDVGDGENGALATVGIQTSTTSGYTMSYNSTGNITPGLVVTCNTNLNTCTRLGLS